MKVSVACLCVFLGYGSFGAKETPKNYSKAITTFKDLAKYGCGVQFTDAQRARFNSCIIKNVTQVVANALSGSSKCKRYLENSLPGSVTVKNSLAVLCKEIKAINGVYTTKRTIV